MTKTLPRSLYRLLLSLTLVSMVNFSAFAVSNLDDREIMKTQTLIPDSPKLRQTIDRLKKRVTENPKDVEVRLLLGKAQLAAGDLDTGIATLKVMNFDIEPRALLLTEKAFELKKEPLERIRLLELSKTQFPDSEFLQLRLGDTYLEAKNNNKAVETYKGVIKRYPRRTSAYFRLLDLYEKTKNVYESRILLSDMTQLFKNDSAVYTKLCKLYATNSFLEEGVETCSKAIALGPRIADNHVYFGLLRKYLKDTEQGEKIIRKAAQQFPRSELAQFTSGQLNDEQKNYEAAKRNYSACVKVDASSSRCWIGLAKSSFQVSDYKTTLAAFEKACALEPTKARVDFRNAVTALRLKKSSEQAEVFSKRFEFCGSD